MNNFSKNLRFLREKNNYTQKEMKLLFGIGDTTWSHYETGKSEPSLESLVKISKFFGITLHELVVEDLERKEKPGSNAKHDSKHYAMNESFSLVEEQPALNYIVKELRRLRQDVDIIKQTENTSG